MLILFLVLFSWSWANSSKPLIILDSGHDPVDQIGAIGTCGQPEVKYNDEITRLIHEVLEKDYRVLLTRTEKQSVSIDQRAKIANNAKCDLFISIHHDSVLDHFKVGDPVCKTDAQGRRTGGIRLNPKFKEKYDIGFNVLIYDDNT